MVSPVTNVDNEAGGKQGAIRDIITEALVTSCLLQGYFLFQNAHSYISL